MGIFVDHRFDIDEVAEGKKRKAGGWSRSVLDRRQHFVRIIVTSEFLLFVAIKSRRRRN
jgi:hypothetical protein